MTPEQIHEWPQHQADAGDKYRLVYLSRGVPAGGHSSADFRAVLSQRSGLDVIGSPLVLGDVMQADVGVLRPDSLGRLVGRYVISGAGSGAYEYELVNVFRTERGAAGANLLSPLWQAGEWIKDQIGFRTTASARDGVLADVAAAPVRVGGAVVDTAADVARRALPPEVWVAIAALAAVALASSLAPTPRS